MPRHTVCPRQPGGQQGRPNRGAEGALEAGIRGVLHIGMAGPGADERAFNVLRGIRGRHGHLTLPELEQLLREQFFALLLDREAALTAIPRMLPAEAETRARLLETIRQIATAAGELDPERASRLRQVEHLFGEARAARSEPAGEEVDAETPPRARKAAARPRAAKRRAPEAGSPS